MIAICFLDALSQDIASASFALAQAVENTTAYIFITPLQHPLLLWYSRQSPPYSSSKMLTVCHTDPIDLVQSQILKYPSHLCCILFSLDIIS